MNSGSTAPGCTAVRWGGDLRIGAEIAEGEIDLLMDFGTPRAGECEVADLYLKSGFRVCGGNDRWFKDRKDSTAVFYGYDL